MRVLHAPTGVGGNAWYLSRAERALGLESDVVVFQSRQFGFKFDRNLRFDERTRWMREVVRWRFLFSAIRYYDIFHFNFGTSLTHYPRLGLYYLDMILLKRVGKPIVMTYQGSDIRPFKVLSNGWGFPSSKTSSNNSASLDRRKVKASSIVSRYADHVYVLNPDLKQYAPRGAEFRPYTKLDFSEWPKMKPKPRGKVLEIVHAPTNRAIKGTKYILKACETLQAQGAPINLTLIEGISREEALQLYLNADIVIDQMLIGWYGGVSLEAMALGKPVICFLRYSDFGVLPGSMAEEIPIVNATPDSLIEVLQELIRDPELCRELGQRGRAFVEKWHDPIKVAGKTKELYESLMSGLA